MDWKDDPFMLKTLSGNAARLNAEQLYAAAGGMAPDDWHDFLISEYCVDTENLKNHKHFMMREALIGVWLGEVKFVIYQGAPNEERFHGAGLPGPEGQENVKYEATILILHESREAILDDDFWAETLESDPKTAAVFQDNPVKALDVHDVVARVWQNVDFGSMVNIVYLGYFTQNPNLANGLKGYSSWQEVPSIVRLDADCENVVWSYSIPHDTTAGLREWVNKTCRTRDQFIYVGSSSDEDSDSSGESPDNGD